LTCCVALTTVRTAVLHCDCYFGDKAAYGESLNILVLTPSLNCLHIVVRRNFVGEFQ